MTKREPIPSTTRRRVMVDAGFRCHYCNRVGHRDIGPGERPWHIDHKHPVVKGGTNERDNLVLSCKRCNLTKNARDYDDFAAYARAAYWVDDDETICAAELNSIAEAWSSASVRYHQVRPNGLIEYRLIADPDAAEWEHMVALEQVELDSAGVEEESSRLIVASGIDANSRAPFEFLVTALRYMPDMLAMVADSRESRRAA